jgi:hypothetical protein
LHHCMVAASQAPPALPCIACIACNDATMQRCNDDKCPVPDPFQTQGWKTAKTEGRAEQVSLLGRVVTDSWVLASLGTSRDLEAGTFPTLLRRATIHSNSAFRGRGQCASSIGNPVVSFQVSGGDFCQCRIIDSQPITTHLMTYCSSLLGKRMPSLAALARKPTSFIGCPHV